MWIERHRMTSAGLTGLGVGLGMGVAARLSDLDPQIPGAPLMIGVVAGLGTTVMLLLLSKSDSGTRGDK